MLPGGATANKQQVLSKANDWLTYSAMLGHLRPIQDLLPTMPHSMVEMPHGVDLSLLTAPFEIMSRHVSFMLNEANLCNCN